MSEQIDTRREAMVEISVERLFAIVKAIYDDGLSGSVLERYGREVVLMTREQAGRWHAFVDHEISASLPPDLDVRRPDFAARRTKLVGPRVKEVMGGGAGGDTPHCTTRP